MPESERDYSISVLDSAVEVLSSFLDETSGDQSLQEIVQRLGLNKSRAFRILATLEQHKLVEQDPETRNYRLGLRLLTFGETVRRRLRLPELARAALDRLAEQTGETVFLGVIEGLEVVCIDKRESTHQIRLYGEIGRRAPLYAGGIPKVLLAHLHAEDPSILDRLEQAQQGIALDREAILQQIAQIRALGYTISRGELDPGAFSIAAPVSDHTGRVVAGVSIAGPSSRLLSEQVDQYVTYVREAAAQISARLAYSPRSP